MKKVDKQVSYSSVDDLFSNYKVGLVSSYVYPDVIASVSAKHPKHSDASKTEEILLNKLMKNRNDVVITDPNVLLFLAKQKNLTGVEELGKLMRKELVISFRNDPDNQKNIDMFQQILENGGGEPDAPAAARGTGKIALL